MSKKEFLKRYIVFFIGMICVSFGVAFITKAALGTSPISAIPYSLSLIITELSLGNWTIIFSIFLVLCQLIMLRSNANKKELLLQAIISFLFGYVIDFAMFCLRTVSPSGYMIQLLLSLAGCCALALGAYFEVVANVVMLPGDGFVSAISKITGKEYGGLRVVSDIGMAAVAAIICWIFLHGLAGVREGTVITALLVGNLVKLCGKLFGRMADKIFPKDENAMCRAESAA